MQYLFQHHKPTRVIGVLPHVGPRPLTRPCWSVHSTHVAANRVQLVKSSQSKHAEAEVRCVVNTPSSVNTSPDACSDTDSGAQRVQHPHVETVEKRLRSPWMSSHQLGFDLQDHVLNPEVSDFDMTYPSQPLVGTRRWELHFTYGPHVGN